MHHDVDRLSNKGEEGKVNVKEEFSHHIERRTKGYRKEKNSPLKITYTKTSCLNHSSQYYGFLKHNLTKSYI